ncbi:hypothetical protein GCM10028828_12610 [Corynebacterium tapiri]
MESTTSGAKPVSTPASASEPLPSSQRAQGPGECATSASNPLLEVPALPIYQAEGIDFTFSVVDEHFLPCADLSWSVIAGGSGSGNSQRQGVVFFHQGRPINSPPPLMQERVLDVQQIDETSVKVSYEILDGPRAAGNTVPGSVIFALDPDDSLKIVENSLPAVANEAGIQLDVSGLS